MKYQQWSIPELPAGAVDRLTGAGYPYLVSSVLASRGITTPEEAAAFLERDRDLPYSPSVSYTHLTLPTILLV